MEHTTQSYDPMRVPSHDTPPPATLRTLVGTGLRSRHYDQILATSPAIDFFEIHPENYFCGGLNRQYLDRIAEHYRLSMHAVGLSLGSDQDVDTTHLKQFKTLIDQYDPIMISDHVSWSASGNAHLNDLLPLPYTAETLTRLSRNIKHTQEYLGRQMLVENPSTYIAFKDNDMSEQDFMNALAQEADCKILLDINNIYVQSHNHGLDPRAYLDTINPDHVGEIHLAGHIERSFGAHTLLIDTHNQKVCDGVWDLFRYAAPKFRNTPTLIEWDQDVPDLTVLLSEIDTARAIAQQSDTAQNQYASS